MTFSEQEFMSSASTATLDDETLPWTAAIQTAQQKWIHPVGLDAFEGSPPLEQSYLSCAARWYGAQSWWVQCLMGMVWIGLIAGLGAIGHLAIPLLVVAVVLYGMMMLLLNNHYARTVVQETRILNEIEAWQVLVKDAMRYLSDLEDQIHRVLTALQQLDVIRRGQISELRDQMHGLKEEIQRLNTTNRDLSSSNASLCESLTQIQAAYETLMQSLNIHQHAIVDEGRQLNLTNTALSDTVSGLAQHEADFKALSAQLAVQSDGVKRWSECLGAWFEQQAQPKVGDRASRHALMDRARAVLSREMERLDQDKGSLFRREEAPPVDEKKLGLR